MSRAVVWIRTVALLALLLLLGSASEGQGTRTHASVHGERAVPSCGNDRIFNQGARGTWDHGRLDCLGAADSC